jgi:hypothetical protein
LKKFRRVCFTLSLPWCLSIAVTPAVTGPPMNPQIDATVYAPSYTLQPLS